MDRQQPLPILNESAADATARHLQEWLARNLPVNGSFPASSARAVNGRGAVEMLKEALEEVDGARLKLFSVGFQARAEELHHINAQTQEASRILDRALVEIVRALRMMGEEESL